MAPVPDHDSASESRLRPRPGPAPARLIRAGWQVHGWAGDRIGEIVERDGKVLMVRLDSVGAETVRIAVDLISDADPSERRATLSVDTSELEGVQPQTDRITLTDGPW